MKTRLLVLLAFMHAATPLSADRGGYRITSFDVELTVEANSDLLVKERLVVDFAEARHGIYRTIPIRYTDPRGYLYSLDFRLLDVVDDTGAAHPTRVTREGKYVKIRIGHPNGAVQGRVVYVVRYRVQDAVAHFAEHDELYWNATGNEWQAPIDAASARVELPAPVARDEIESAAYTGVFGSREKEAIVDYPEDSVIRYRTSTSLAPLEGLSIVAAWPHGLVTFPGAVGRTMRFVRNNWIVLTPFLALVFLTRRYWTAGRDPRGPASVVVQYEPPPDLTPGEIGALVDERVDLRDLTATLVDLAIRGYLRIRVDQKDRLFGLLKKEETWFERSDRSWDDLREHERKVLAGIFVSGSVVSTEDLEEKFYEQIPKIRDALWEDLANRRFVTGNPSSVRFRWKALGVVAGLLTVALGYTWAAFRGAIFPHALLLPIVAGAVVAFLFFAFSRGMPRRTRKGVELRAWALGFEEFVDRVERDNLEAQRQKNVFEALLPYAMALGVAAAWARQFEGIYASAPPVWFHGNAASTSGFSTPRFERTLTTAMSRAGTGMTAAPRSQGSSGFGGGGFSGGGGGGGGGGSW
ncbi:MAG: hypothetical protein BMS9Abin37_3067 [Acidobacteriota bacterium]|nr:MAG: hypothetical protein BMS9Abin37_3067 [Acidobacteriota bacterium]